MRRWLDGVRDSESSQRVMLIAGEAGMGKSRLVREAKAMAAEHGFDVLQGKSDHVLRTSEVRSTYLRAHISSGGPSVSVP